MLGIPGAPTLPDVSTTALQNQYTDSFNGTSAATPMVSGVVALMLQASPKLTWRDVPLILARSARQVDAQSSGWRSHSNSPMGAATTSAPVECRARWKRPSASR